MTYADPAMVKSNFERLPGERYFTEHWCTEALLRHLDLSQDVVLEPACGRGDMVKALQSRKLNVIASDIDLSEFDMFACPCEQEDFFTTTPWWLGKHLVTAIVTNPPYDKAEEFLRYALSLDVEVVAMLLRSEFNQASSRVDLFGRAPFAFEIALTTRPRWDWWFRDKPEASPRHNFSWFCWDKSWIGPSTQFFEGKKER